MAGSKQPSVLLVHGHVQQQGASNGRLGTFTGSSQDIYKKQGSAMSSTPVTRWRPTAFDFKSGSSTICPTCQGTGRIPKGAWCIKLSLAGLLISRWRSSMLGTRPPLIRLLPLHSTVKKKNRDGKYYMKLVMIWLAVVIL